MINLCLSDFMETFKNLLWIYFTQSILVSPSSRFMLQLLFVVIDQPKLSIQIYSNLSYSLLFSTTHTDIFTTFCLLLFFRCGIFSWCNNFSATNEMEVSNGFTSKLFAIVFRTLSKFPPLVHWTQPGMRARIISRIFLLFGLR